MNDTRPLPTLVPPVTHSVLLAFSHLRWNFVFQRPQHLMTRAAMSHSVYFIEEPLHADTAPHYRMQFGGAKVTVLTPVFARDCDPVFEQRQLLRGLVDTLRTRQLIQWFYTPMALRFASDVVPDITVYDCMDELSAFRFAPADLPDLERRLLARADLVFTGGASLYAAKARLHNDVSCFPSSVDVAHFAKAKEPVADPQDQSGLAKPRIGYFGVIDERMDLGLVARAAAALPDVQFVMLGPVVKVDSADLPRAQNLHWLGQKDYADLPAYMAHWQAAWMPFALNESTRFISPTKTPEFLAAGLPVTSTAVADVAASWGDLVTITDADGMSKALRSSLLPAGAEWRIRVENRMAQLSWDRTWAAMAGKIDAKQRLTVAS
jgi:glycosyltransferase involved in cell wall biosynthesis